MYEWGYGWAVGRWAVGARARGRVGLRTPFAHVDVSVGICRVCVGGQQDIISLETEYTSEGERVSVTASGRD